jgi:small nuclear ribonucleoprotein (snRNP)-like protein
MNIYPYEGEKVRIKCKDGRVYTGVVKRCSPACGIDVSDDILVIGRTEILASEIETIETIEPAD